MTRRFWISLVLLVAVLAAAGCGGLRGGRPKPQAPAAPPASPAPVEAPGFPLTITDDAGRVVRIDRRPERLLSLAPSNTEILYALGLEDRVVGTDSFSNYPEAAKGKPKVGGIVDPDFEKMVSLKPDLAFAIGGSTKIVPKLDELKIPVVVVKAQTFDDVFRSLRFIAEATGVKERAEPVIAALMRRRDGIVAKTAGLPEEKRPLVFYEVWPEPLRSAGPGSFIHDMIGLAGGRNVAAQAKTAWPEISVEAVVAANPHLIVTPFERSATELTSGARKGWNSIAAVKDGNVRLINQDIISRPGPRLVEGLETMARLIHPELFGP